MRTFDDIPLAPLRSASWDRFCFLDPLARTLAGTVLDSTHLSENAMAAKASSRSWQDLVSLIIVVSHLFGSLAAFSGCILGALTATFAALRLLFPLSQTTHDR